MEDDLIGPMEVLKELLSNHWVWFLGGLFVFLALFVLSACSDHATRYRRNPNGKSLYAVLYSQVDNGDELKDIEKLIGQGKVLTTGITEKILLELRRQASDNPKKFPDGILDSDTFIGFSVGRPRTIVLMFRDSVLINYDKDRFAHYNSPFEK